MEDSKSYLRVAPAKELEFHRPFTTVVKQSLVVTNQNPDSPICFKVKTTAPKQYCVRPNSAVVPPGDNAEVQVLLQAMKEDPPEGYVCKDKFLIQSIKVPNDVMGLDGDELTARLHTLWSQAEQLKKSSPAAAAEVLVERKLRCVFLPQLGANGVEKKDSQLGANTQSEISRQPSVKQEFSDASSTSPRSSMIVDKQVPELQAQAESLPSTRPTSVQFNAEARPPSANVTSQQAQGSLADSFHQPTLAEKQLQEAREKIKTLQSACDGYKAEIERLNLLRQRRGDPAAGKDGSNSAGNTSTVMAPAPVAGLTLPVVAATAVVAFAIGATFF
ncbi:hypothetical protein SpCBS45565_g02515 [Spizellomyces sp. 'palustris']|nr:hypothetical protein SpCBS45565_g02515 [Spizellomyces sp. 'palustris']